MIERNFVCSASPLAVIRLCRVLLPLRRRQSMSVNVRVRVVWSHSPRAVVVKPEGIPTVGGNAAWTAERMLPYYLASTHGVQGVLCRPRPVHRLDLATGRARGTGGVSTRGFD
jgi:23S rRNA-/tRNA-specific pseudouridylate synthase